MKNFTLVLILVLIILSCKSGTTSVKIITDFCQANLDNSIKTRLNDYFYKYEIKPSMIINNTEGNQKDISFLNHRIKWLTNEKETNIQIDNDLFSLKNEVTLNYAWDKVRDSLKFVNNWDQINYFKHNDRELIGIRMSYDPCLGIGCSAFFFLIYDLKHKTKNFFGTFRTNNEVNLFHFGNDLKIKYLSKTFKGDPHGELENECIYELYSLDNSGKFVNTKNSKGEIYQITLTTMPNDTIGNRYSLKANWIEEIK
jgi:hypothetical protein